MIKIEVKNITKIYGDKKILDNISFNIEEGKIYGLLGRNGVGKTTLLNIISNRIFQKSGEVYIDGENANGNEKVLSKLYLMGEKDYLPQGMKVTEGLKWTKTFYEKFDMKYAMELSKAFDLNTKSRLKELSTGYKSIFKIIITLASGADILIFDEPVLGLDANHRELFYSELLKFYSKEEKTIILSTHLIEEITDILEKVIIIKDGKVIEESDVEELLLTSYCVSGKAEDVEKFIVDKKPIAIENLSGFKRATILDGKTKEDEIKIRELGLEVSKVDLQKIFIYLTNKEEMTDEE